MARWFKATCYSIAALLYIFVSSSILVFHGPFPAVRSYIIETLATTRHAYLLGPLSLFTLSNAEIEKYSVDWTRSANVASTALDRNFRASSDNSPPVFYTERYPTFEAQIVLVRNPKRVHVAVTQWIGQRGETVLQLVNDHHALLGVNAGAFSDAGWRGNGGIPLGTTISYGQVVRLDPSAPLIGITESGQLVCGTYTAAQMSAMHIQEAVSFGPILVQNGRDVAPADYSYQPRVAIGQRADGTIIFIVTSGRFVLGPNDLGSTYRDVAKLMLKYGAVTAANLDGGSSATLVYRGQILNHPADVLGARLVATAWVVN
jgi:exopolysaccharide biosynthesis protein